MAINQNISTLMAPSDSVDKSFLFISSASLPKPEYRAESICLQHEYPQDAFQKLSKNELKPQAVLLADYQELSVELMKLLSSLNIPVIIYTPVYIQEAKEMALKVRADDYLSGPIDADFIEYVEFLKKIKSYKRKNIRVVKKGSASRISASSTTSVRGIPEIKSRPLIIMVLRSSKG